MEGHVRAFLTALGSDDAYSSSTRMAYENDLRCFVAYLQDSLTRSPRLSDFTTRQVADFLEHERVQGLRHSTLIRRRATLRRFARFLKKQFPDKVEQFDPSSKLIDLSLGRPAETNKPNYLGTDQLEAVWAVLLASPSPRARRDHALMAILLEMGLSVASLVALDLQDVNLEAGMLCLAVEEDRQIWISLGEAGEPLQRYLQVGRPELNCSPEEQALFVSQTGRRMSRQGVWQVLRQWGRRARLEEVLTPRLVRHTAAFRLAKSGRSLEDIQALLGHTNPLSTHALLRRLKVDLVE